MSLSFRRKTLPGPSQPGQNILNWLTSSGFEKFYTPRVRIYAHTVMWVLHTLLYTLTYLVLFPDSLGVELIFALRNTLGAMIFFYPIFYFIIPRLLQRGRFLVGIILLFLPFLAWCIINYWTALFVDSAFTIHNEEVKLPVKRLVHGGFSEAVSISRALQYSLAIIMTIAPSMSVKLVLDIIRATTRTLRLERDNLNLEIDFLKSQLNPHFLFNTLNNIYALSIRNDKLAADLILNLSNMMRYTLYDSNTPMVQLSKEVAFLKNYVDLESIRYGKKASILFECDQEQIQEQQVAPLLMFPFIENAFKHSHNAAIDKCWIKVSIHVDGDHLCFIAANSKEETPVKKREVGGIGIVNSKKRLALLYPDKHSLVIDDASDQFKVTMKLTIS
ncbi:hypothetical protein F0L74_13585 [Chitinophaga agrisoli]|uniref:Signal transduction histidine kinase internal region domain-containing protein n=1 Tax=Chitinophaga agrisoli TaxID=2607653 RepID=A0A5B2VZN7_9BACT|nr:hypothetical protein F0L74_13585 [Chitinophaga agrisoli]